METTACVSKLAIVRKEYLLFSLLREVDHLGGLEEVFLPYQLVGSIKVNQDSYGYGESVFDSGEGA